MVEIFKTNVRDKRAAQQIICILNAHFKTTMFNFDLQDCDNILRAENSKNQIPMEEITSILRSAGYQCELLEEELYS